MILKTGAVVEKVMEKMQWVGLSTFLGLEKDKINFYSEAQE